MVMVVHVRALSLVVLVAATLLARVAAADEVWLGLAFEAPAECGTREDLAQSVTAMVHPGPHRLLAATVRIDHTPSGYVAEVSTGPGSSRQVTASDCRAVTDAVAVIVALTLDPHAETGKLAAPSAPAPSGRALFATIGVAASAASGTLPSLAAGGTVRFGLAARHWTGNVELTAYVPQRAALALDPARGGYFTFWTAGLAGCAVPFAGRLHGLLCLAPELGRLGGTGRGATPRKTAGSLWFGITAGPALEWAATGALTLRAAVGATLALVEPRPFVLDGPSGAEEVLRPRPLSLRGSLGADFRF